MKKHINIARMLASISGNIIEWYDFALLGLLAPTLSQIIYVEQDPMAALLATLLIYAIGFLVRPLGAILFGHIGDSYGRAHALKLSIALITIASLGMALVPSYHSAGIMAPILFSGLRILQGLALGGEFAGAMIYLTESAPNHHRAYYASMTNNGSNFGILIATLIATALTNTLSPEAFNHFGWRIAYGIGGIMGLIGFKFRSVIEETTVYEKIQSRYTLTKLPLKQVLDKYPSKLRDTIGLLAMSAAGSYLLMGYLSTYLHTFGGLSLAAALRIQSGFILATFGLVPLFGLCADQFGRRPIVLFASAVYLLCAIPCYSQLHHINSAWLALLPLLIAYAAEQGTTPALMVENFPAEVRYTGVSIAYNCTMAVIGGLLPFTVTWLTHKYDNKLIVAYALMAFAVWTGITVTRRIGHEFGENLELV